MPEGVSRVVQTDGHRMNCRQRRHISTAYLAHTHRRGAVQWRMPLPPSSAETKIVTITGSELTVIKDEPLGFHVTTPVLTRASIPWINNTPTTGYTRAVYSQPHFTHPFLP